MAKKLTVLIEFEVDDSVSEDAAAGELEAALKPLAAKVVSAGTVKVISPARQVAKGGAAAGYESRLWEKATC